MKNTAVDTEIRVYDKKQRKISKLPKETKEKVEKEIEFLQEINKFFEKAQKSNLTAGDEFLFKIFTNILFDEYKKNEKKLFIFDTETKKKIEISKFEFLKQIDSDIKIFYGILIKEV